METDLITNQDTFDTWYKFYNSAKLPGTWFTNNDFDANRPGLFMTGIQPLIIKGIDDRTLIVVKDFEALIPEDVPQAERDRRVNKYCSVLKQAFQEQNITYEQLVIWGNSAFDDLPTGGNAMGVGSGGASVSTAQIERARKTWANGWIGDYTIDNFVYFYGPVKDENDLTGDIYMSYDETYQFPLLRDFINDHFNIYTNRNVSSWDKFLEVAAGGYIDTDVQTNDELLEESAVSGSLKALDDAAAGVGEGSSLSEGKTNFELKQCAIMTMLFDPSRDLRDLASSSSRKEETIRDQKIYSYFLKNRIIPLYLDPSEKIEHMCNYFYSDENIKKFFEQKNFQNKMRKEIFYVYEDKDNNLKEIKLKKSSVQGDLNLAIDRLYDPSSDSYIDELDRLKPKYYDSSNQYKYYRLDDINIEYNGSTPSTARNDVKVTLKFHLESFAALEAVIAENISPLGLPENETRDLLLRDLVISPIDDDGKSNLTSALQNTYHPSRNRIRLKVQAEDWYDNRTIGSEDKYTQPPMILDLTTIDHELSRDSSTGTVSFTINYRGYMQSLMQMPFADALMTDGSALRRKNRAKNIKSIIGKGCTKETLREILRVERNTTQSENTNNFSTIYSDLQKNKRIFGATFQHTNWDYVLEDLPRSGQDGFVSGLYKPSPTEPGFWRTGFGASQTQILTSLSKEGDISQSTAVSKLNGAIGVNDNAFGNRKLTHFVFLGDLILSVSKNLYKNENNDEVIEELQNKLRFIIAPIDLPNPKADSGYTRINPIEIPIDLFFFAEWFHEVIVKKDLRTYPVAYFIRDLIERLVNNLLYETCIANLLPDESPPKLRVGYFSSTSIDSINHGFDLAKIYDINLHDFDNETSFKFGYLDVGIVSKPLFINEIDFDSVTPVDVHQTDYIVVYCDSPPFKRELASQDSGQLRNEKFVPTLINGVYAASGISMMKSISLKKTNSPFLREARYFNNNFGSLALMNNVYNLSFQIEDSAANNYLYPGMLINVIIADFSSGGDNGDALDYEDGLGFQPPGFPIVPGDFLNGYRATDSDPHFRKDNGETTPAHIMGMGGYFIIKSVSYSLGNSDRKFSIDVDCMFLGTEADVTVKRNTDVKDIISTDKAECLTAYNEAVKINQAAITGYNDNRSSEQEEKKSEFSEIVSAAPSIESSNNNTTQVSQADSSEAGE